MTKHLRRPIRLAILLALFAGVLAGPATMAEAQTSGIPSVGTNFGSIGPYSVTVQTAANHTYYSPTNLGANGVRHPVLLWGNGTGASPSSYDGLLRHWASHGFIVAAANTPNAGSGAEMLQGLTNLSTFNSSPTNRFYQRVDLTKVGASGHSQGALGAARAAADSRVSTAMPVEGAARASGVTGSIFYLAGERDTIARPASIRSAYDAATTLPAAYGELRGATHFTPAGDGGGFRGATTAWARWMLMDDTNARGWFVGPNCTLCQSSSWDYVANARLQALGGGGNNGGNGGSGECVRASTRSHVSNDRAVVFLSTVYARGSGDNLGRNSLFNIVSLQQTGPNAWTRVSSC